MRFFKRGSSHRRIARAGRRLLAAVLAFLAAGWMVAPAWGGELQNRWSLKVGGGIGLLGWGDVEALKNSFHQNVQYAAERLGIETTGSCENPRAGWHGEVELCLELNRRFSLGLAIGYHKRSGETVLRADWPPYLASSHAWSQASTVTPATLNAYWRIPLGSRSGVYVRAGAGLAWAVWKYRVRDEETMDFTSWEQIEGTARDRGFVFQAGLGFEIRIMKRLAAFVEARGQILSLGDWRTDQFNSTDAASEMISARLWLAEVAFSGGRPAQALLLASATRPAAWLYDGVRPVRLNLSGGIFLAGLRLELDNLLSSSNPR